MVVAPAGAEKIVVKGEGGRRYGRIVSWTHGTLGIAASCQPSTDPAKYIWGPVAFGIGAVGWGTEKDPKAYRGKPEDGILQGMIDYGWVVTATDYFVGSEGDGKPLPYIIGKIEAANGLDAIRAAHHLLKREYADLNLSSYDTIIWGHSQGGHAAIWSGQLASSYFAATTIKGAPEFRLKGVALEAPASNFIVDPKKQPTTAPGFGLVDWDLHQSVRPAGGHGELMIGPWIFSYLIDAWHQYSQGLAPSFDAMPAFPATGPLSVEAILSAEGIKAMSRVAPLCWTAKDLLVIAECVAKFEKKPFFTGHLNDGEAIDGYQHGNLGATCAGSPPESLRPWCDWAYFNNPGPAGKNPLAKVPTQDGNLVPIFMAAGSNDNIVHCMAPKGMANEVPSAKDCMEKVLYDSLSNDAYCPNDQPAKGYLEFKVWRPRKGITSANHTDIAGLAAAASPDDLSFKGSPLQKFMTAAFAGALKPGCDARVVDREEGFMYMGKQ